jgi:hypothetical protein
MRCSSSAVTPNAIRLARPSTNTVSRTEVPPASEASAWIAVASGPYTDGDPNQSWTARATGSPSAASWAGVVVYGLWPVTSIRP